LPNQKVALVTLIQHTLQDYSSNITIYDPWVDMRYVKEEYGVEIETEKTRLGENKYNAIILAVSHKAFNDLDLSKLVIDKNSTVIYDIKGVLPTGIIDGRL